MVERNIPKVTAKHGEKMITVTVRFWTNDLATEKGTIRRRHAWSSGMVTLDGNKSHAIEPGPSIPFHTLMDIGAAIEKALIKGDVTLHPSKKLQKYLQNGH